MAKDGRDPFSSSGRDDIFNVPERSMSDDVNNAARILQSFVSEVSTPSEGSQELLYGVNSAEGAMFNPGASSPSLSEIKPDLGLAHLMQQATHVSEHLTDAMEFVPRVVEGDSGVFSLHPKEEIPIPSMMGHPPLRLRYKGKATKKQLERLRRRIQLHTQDL